MAIEDLIAQGVIRPPQVDTPTEAYGKAMQLRHLADQSALNQMHMQAYALENQQRSHLLQAQQALGDSVRRNTAQSPDGSLVTDHGAVVRDMVTQGYNDAGFKYDADRRANETAALDAHKKRLDIGKEQVDRISNLLTPVQQAIDAGDIPRASSLYTVARAAALNPKNPIVQDPNEVPPQFEPDWVRTHVAMALKADQQLANARQMAEFHQRELEQAPVTADKWHQAVFNRAAKADSADQYDLIRRNLSAQGAPDSALAELPAMWSPTVQEALAQQALTEEQRQTLALHKDQADALGQYRQDSMDLRRELAEDKRTQRDQTANSRAVDNRQARSEFDKATRDERDLNNLSISLGNAIKNRAFYVNKYGNTIPMTKAAGDTGESVDALVEEMQDRYRQARGDLHNVVDTKYNLMDKLGATPRVSREDVHRALDAGAGMQPKTPQTSPASATKPTARTPATRKPLSRATAVQYLQRAGGDKQKATDLAEADGYDTTKLAN